MKETPKNVYDRNDWKRETEKLIDAVCTCERMHCVCNIEEEEDDADR
jgi:hypothetical protein